MGFLFFLAVAGLAYFACRMLRRAWRQDAEERKPPAQRAAERKARQEAEEARRDAEDARKQREAEERARARPRPLEIGPHNNVVQPAEPPLAKDSYDVRKIRSSITNASRDSGVLFSDDRLLRDAFDQTIDEIHPKPIDESALYAVIEKAFLGGSTRPAARAAKDLLPPELYWPQYDRRKEELESDGVDAEISMGTMPEMLVRRVVMLAYQARRRQQMIEAAETRPHWQFVSVANSRTPADCAAKHDAMHPARSSFWNGEPPCWRPDCNCRIRSHSDFSLKRRSRTR